MEIEEVKEQVREIIKEELKSGDYSAFFFGSRIVGNYSKTSDLDVGFDGPDLVPKDIMYKIKSRIDAIPSLYSIDIVDLQSVGDEFKKIAKSKIEEIK